MPNSTSISTRVGQMREKMFRRQKGSGCVANDDNGDVRCSFVCHDRRSVECEQICLSQKSGATVEMLWEWNFSRLNETVAVGDVMNHRARDDHGQRLHIGVINRESTYPSFGCDGFPNADHVYPALESPQEREEVGIRSRYFYCTFVSLLVCFEFHMRPIPRSLDAVFPLLSAFVRFDNIFLSFLLLLLVVRFWHFYRWCLKHIFCVFLWLFNFFLSALITDSSCVLRLCPGEREETFDTKLFIANVRYDDAKYKRNR